MQEVVNVEFKHGSYRKSQIKFKYRFVWRNRSFKFVDKAGIDQLSIRQIVLGRITNAKEKLLKSSDGCGHSDYWQRSVAEQDVRIDVLQSKARGASGQASEYEVAVG